MTRIVVVVGPKLADEALERGLEARPGPTWDRVDRFEDDHARFMVGTYVTSCVDAGASSLLVEEDLVVAFDGLITNSASVASATGARVDASHAMLVASALRRWGIDAPRMLEGEFAFVAYHRGRGTVFCAVDPFAIRTLHHAFDRDRRALATEPRACRRALGLPLRPNPKVLVNVLAGYPVTRDTSLYEGVHHLAAGTSLELSRGEAIARDTFTPEPSGDSTDLERDSLERVHHALYEATKARVLSSERVGVLASGGLDSTVVTALATRAAREHGRPDPVLFHFSAGSHEADESPLARKLARHFGLALHVFEASGRRVPRMLELHEFSGATSIVYREMYRAAASMGVRVLLTGEGSDDPQSPTSFECEDALSRRNWSAAAAHAGISTQPFSSAAWRKMMRAAIDPLLSSEWLDRRAWRRFIGGVPSWITSRGRELLREALDDRSRFERRIRNDSPHRRRLMTNLVWNPSMTLTNQIPNLFAAENGIETRHPFYDRTVMALMYRLPAERLHRTGEQKPFTRKLAARLVPHDLAYRKTPTDYGDFHVKAFSDLAAWTKLLEEGRLFELGIVDGELLLRELAARGGPPSFSEQLAFLAEDWLWSLDADRKA